MALATVDLHRIVLAVEVVDRADLPIVGDPGVGVAEIPAAAVVADDQLRAPGAAFVFADLGADPSRHQAVTVDHHQPGVGQLNEATGRTKIVDATEELPSPPAIVAGDHLSPHNPARIALTAQHAQHASAGQQVTARVEPAVPAEAERTLVIAVRRPVRIAFGGDESQKVKVGTTWR